MTGTVRRSDSAVRSRYVMAVDLEGLGCDDNRQRCTGLIFLRGYVLFRDTIDTLADIVRLSRVNMIIRLEIVGESPGSGGQDVFTDNRKSMYALGLSHHTGGNL
jgi:hypothetical protein